MRFPFGLFGICLALCVTLGFAPARAASWQDIPACGLAFPMLYARKPGRAMRRAAWFKTPARHLRDDAIPFQPRAVETANSAPGHLNGWLCVTMTQSSFDCAGDETGLSSSSGPRSCRGPPRLFLLVSVSSFNPLIHKPAFPLAGLFVPTKHCWMMHAFSVPVLCGHATPLNRVQIPASACHATSLESRQKLARRVDRSGRDARAS